MTLRKVTPQRAREINKFLILHLLRSNGTLSRVDIARKLNLSKVTVSNIITDLIKEKYVYETGFGFSLEKGGRKPIILSLNKNNHYIIGVDLGTTNTVCAIGNLNGDIIDKIQMKTPKDHQIDTIIKHVVDNISILINKNNIKNDYIRGLGIAVAGQVDKKLGRIIFSPHFNWYNVDIVNLLEKKTGFRTVADNCTRVMTLGEIWHGKGKGVKNLLFINIGYGIGSALVIEGKIYQHHSEFGHIFVTKKKIKCPCGKYGCLEVVASGNAIEKNANKLLNHSKNGWITAKELAELAQNGNIEAKKVFDDAGRYLGRGISILANSLNPDKIIIGGGISKAGDLLFKPVLKEFNKHTILVINNNVEVLLSSMGTEAGIQGAIALALNEFIFNYDLVSNQIVSSHSKYERY